MITAGVTTTNTIFKRQEDAKTPDVWLPLRLNR
jgi:hypothetical protein